MGYGKKDAVSDLISLGALLTITIRESGRVCVFVEGREKGRGRERHEVRTAINMDGHGSL